APVAVDGRPIGILIGVDKAKADQIRVLRLDFIARMVDPQWLGPVLASAADGTGSSNSLEASRIFWNALALSAMGRQASARRTFERAAIGGSAAARLHLATMLIEGEGGPRDQESGSAMFDRYLSEVFGEAERGDAAAGLTLLSLNTAGKLTVADAARAVGPVRAIGARLAARGAAGDSAAATWWALYRRTDLDLIAGEAQDALASRFGVSSAERRPRRLLEGDCKALACAMEQIRSAYQATIAAMEGGSEIAALLLADTNLRELVQIDPGAEIPIPSCARLEGGAADPVRLAALAACTQIRRSIALRRFDLIAFDRAEDRSIWKAAIDAGMFIYPSNLVDLAGEDKETLSIRREAARRAWEIELNAQALLSVAAHAIAERRSAEAAQHLRDFLARTSSDDEDRGTALGMLAGVLLGGGTAASPDEASLRGTISLIHRLPGTQITNAYSALYLSTLALKGMPANRRYAVSADDLLGVDGPQLDGPKSDRPVAGPILDALLRLAAQKGSGEAIAELMDTDIKREDIAASKAGALHPYMRALLIESPIEALDLICYASQPPRGSKVATEDAIRLCESFLAQGLPSIAPILARLHDDRKARHAALYRGAALGSVRAAELLATELLDATGADVPRAHQFLRQAARDGSVDAIGIILRLLVEGKLPWDESYFQYLVRMADRLGGQFYCTPGMGSRPTAATGCPLIVSLGGPGTIGGEAIGWLGAGQTADPDVPILSQARFDALKAALALNGASVVMEGMAHSLPDFR
ncbi:MAG TPA: hypothetical protein VEA60_06120, partial [Allosphingosinicella sp.]|nr:hypothetical protein [Allosphingosinicella sp.]